MKDLSILQIETLMAHFFEGRTSTEEEKALYSFFTQQKLPPELEAYKPLFAGFDRLAVLDSNKAKQKEIKRFRRLVFRPFIRSLTAAVLVLGLSITALHIFSTPKEFDPYEGSYIIRNGVKITDPKQVHSLLESTIQQYLAFEQEQIDKYSKSR